MRRRMAEGEKMGGRELMVWKKRAGGGSNEGADTS